MEIRYNTVFSLKFPQKYGYFFQCFTYKIYELENCWTVEKSAEGKEEA